MIFNIINMIAILGLVAVTYMYMRHTKRMADIMVRDYESKVAPIIKIQLGPKTHSSEGFKIQCSLSNLGFYPVRTSQILMKWWYKKKPEITHLIEKDLDKFLDKENPITETFMLHDDEIKNPEIPESLELNGYHLGRIVEASIWLNFYDMNGRIQPTEKKTLDPLMS